MEGRSNKAPNNPQDQFLMSYGACQRRKSCFWCTVSRSSWRVPSVGSSFSNFWACILMEFCRGQRLWSWLKNCAAIHRMMKYWTICIKFWLQGSQRAGSLPTFWCDPWVKSTLLSSKTWSELRHLTTDCQKISRSQFAQVATMTRFHWVSGTMNTVA